LDRICQSSAILITFFIHPVFSGFRVNWKRVLLVPVNTVFPLGTVFKQKEKTRNFFWAEKKQATPVLRFFGKPLKVPENSRRNQKR
jgi:hypothetical protein